VKHIPDAIRLELSETPAAACDVLSIAVEDVDVALLGTPGDEVSLNMQMVDRSKGDMVLVTAGRWF